jgi:hypothetical protein
MQLNNLMHSIRIGFHVALEPAPIPCTGEAGNSPNGKAMAEWKHERNRLARKLRPEICAAAGVIGMVPFLGGIDHPDYRSMTTMTFDYVVLESDLAPIGLPLAQ